MIAIAAIGGIVVVVVSVVTVVANNDMQSRRKVIQYKQNIFSTYLQCTSVYVRVCLLINFPFSVLHISVRSMRFDSI